MIRTNDYIKCQLELFGLYVRPAKRVKGDDIDPKLAEVKSFMKQMSTAVQ